MATIEIWIIHFFLHYGVKRGIIWATDFIFEPGSIVVLVPELAACIDLTLIQYGRHQNLDFLIILLQISPQLQLDVYSEDCEGMECIC
jgi:hypothetical protein